MRHCLHHFYNLDKRQLVYSVVVLYHYFLYRTSYQQRPWSLDRSNGKSMILEIGGAPASHRVVTERGRNNSKSNNHSFLVHPSLAHIPISSYVSTTSTTMTPLTRSSRRKAIARGVGDSLADLSNHMSPVRQQDGSTKATSSAASQQEAITDVPKGHQTKSSKKKNKKKKSRKVRKPVSGSSRSNNSSRVSLFWNVPNWNPDSHDLFFFQRL